VARTKPEVTFLVVIVTAGFYLGSNGPLDWMPQIHTLCGTMPAAGGRAAIRSLIQADFLAPSVRPSGRFSLEELLTAPSYRCLGQDIIAGWVRKQVRSRCGLQCFACRLIPAAERMGRTHTMKCISKSVTGAQEGWGSGSQRSALWGSRELLTKNRCRIGEMVTYPR
jgi:hypothetical protein